MLKNWLLASRPKTLLASVSPVMIGSSLAFRDHGFHFPAAIAALVGAITIQVGTNFCNDFFDFRQGADTADRKGPTRAVQAGLISPNMMLIATAAMFAFTGIVCVYLVRRGGWPIAVIGIASVLSGIWYTASRYSLAYLGLGDLFVLVFFGPVAVVGTYYVQTLSVASDVFIAGLAPGFLSVAILVVNNLRDVEEDAAARKRTLAVRYGRGFARLEYMVCIASAGAIPIVLWAKYDWSVSVLAASLVVLPGFVIASRLYATQGPSLNPYLGKTAGLLLLYSVVFSATCVLS